MKEASVTEVRWRFGTILKATEGGPVVVTRDGKPVAVLVGIRDADDVERLLMASSPRLRAILDTSRREIDEGRGIGHDEFWADAPEAAPAKATGRRKKPNGNAPAKPRRRGTSTPSRGPY